MGIGVQACSAECFSAEPQDARHIFAGIGDGASAFRNAVSQRFDQINPEREPENSIQPCVPSENSTTNRDIISRVERIRWGCYRVTLTNMPRSGRYVDHVITSLNVNNLNYYPNGIRQGAVIRHFQSVSGIFYLGNPRQPGLLRVLFRCASPETVNIPMEMPIITTETVDRNIFLIGGWPLVRGDANMDTDGNDRVPVKCDSRLQVNDNTIYLEVYFYCQEFGGNHTTYSGSRRIVVYQCPAGKRIRSINATTTENFSALSIGQNHSFRSFVKSSVSHWYNLMYRIDGPHSNDNQVVGVRGRLLFSVNLEE